MNFVFDIDGTISFNGQTIAPEISAAIVTLQRAGNRVIFASARPIRDLLPIIPAFKDCTLIGANGALIANKQQVKSVRPITDHDSAVVKQLIESEALSYVIDGQWDYAAAVPANHQILKQLDPGKLANRVLMTTLTNIIKIILLDLSSEQIVRLSDHLKRNTELAVIQHTTEGNLDLTAKGVNKWTTLQYLGVDHYVAFGNDQNDLEMLANADTSVWVTSKPILNELGRQMDQQCMPKTVADRIRSFI